MKKIDGNMDQRLLGRHHEVLLSQLLEIQEDVGYLSKDCLRKFSFETGIPLTKIEEIATFYSLINTKPVGRHIIRVCENPSCYVNGSKNILKTLEEHLGISVGETSEDGRFTLELTSCIGCCDGAPAAMVDGKIHTKLDKKKILEILSKCR